ncbi:MAG: zinc ABC transporter substrate-binding protein [Candidatus Lindowbacteria bacterium]|nr:zinc ABC transporter substrate-binding protein [Candidatus Lindowbacteria bacterium]
MLDPAHESYYRSNLEAYVQQLDATKERVAERLSGLPNKKIITFHDAWPYFAEEFGFEIVGSFEPFPGKQPTPRYLAELQQKVRQNDIKSLFSEPQLSTEAIEALASDLGLKLYILDPLGGVEGRNSYADLFAYNADVIVEALSNGK